MIIDIKSESAKSQSFETDDDWIYYIIEKKNIRIHFFTLKQGSRI